VLGQMSYFVQQSSRLRFMAQTKSLYYKTLVSFGIIRDSDKF